MQLRCKVHLVPAIKFSSLGIFALLLRCRLQVAPDLLSLIFSLAFHAHFVFFAVPASHTARGHQDLLLWHVHSHCASVYKLKYDTLQATREKRKKERKKRPQPSTHSSRVMIDKMKFDSRIMRRGNESQLLHSTVYIIRRWEWKNKKIYKKMPRCLFAFEFTHHMKRNTLTKKFSPLLMLSKFFSFFLLFSSLFLLLSLEKSSQVWSVSERERESVTSKKVAALTHTNKQIY